MFDGAVLDLTKYAKTENMDSKVDKTGVTLGIASDGLIYVFIDGEPVGTGILQGQSADVYGYVDENNVVTLTGNLADEVYTFAFKMDDGTLVAVGTLNKVEEESAYTNLADPTSSEWQEGYRLSLSAGTTSALEGHVTSNYIPCRVGDVLRVKGLDLIDETNTGGSSGPKICTYYADKVNAGGYYGVSGSVSAEGYVSVCSVENDIFTYTVLLNNNGIQTDKDIRYLRVDGFLLDGYTSEDVIITINEEIV